MSFYVRTASKKDLEKLIYFTIAEAVEAEGVQIAPDVAARGIEYALEHPDISQYWVLESSKSGPIGCVSVKKEWSVWNAAFYWWFQRMFLLPEYRGQRLPKLLIDHVRDQARRARAVELRLYVHQDNEQAIRAYIHAGFNTSPHNIMIMQL
jgi:GNAT superfamily N-acetyltransferase